MLTRLMSAIKTGFSAAVTDWRVSLYPVEQEQWSAYQTRQIRYWLYEAYYNNFIYDSVLNLYANRIKESHGLNRHVRGIYNPIARVVDVYPSYVYGGNIDYQNFATGSLPLDVDDRLIEPLATTLRASNWQVNNSIYVRNGAKFGDSYIKVRDDRVNGQIRLDVLDPRFIKWLDMDDNGNIIEAHIEYERQDDSNVKPMPALGVVDEYDTYVYTEVITPDSFKTYKDGQEHAFYALDNGEPVSEWENIYGFVPLVQAQHIRTSFNYGTTPFANSTRKIDEINDAASLLNDSIRKSVNPLWFMPFSKPDSTSNPADTDELPAIYASGAERDPYPMVFNVDVSGAMENIRQMLTELEYDMPELKLNRLADANLSDISGVALRTLYNDAIQRINEAQSNYDDPLRRAMNMALRMGAQNNYEPYRGLSVDNDYDIRIKPRSIIGDTPDIKTKLSTMLSSGAPASAVWRELGFGDDDIDSWLAEQNSRAEEQDAAINEAIRGMSTDG